MYGQESTRPRIVDTAPVTPAFNPNEPSPIDVQALIQQLMQPAPAEPPPDTGWQGKLGSIMEAIAGGVGVGLSNDLGQALLQQVEGLKQRNFSMAEAEKARKDAQEKLNRQFGLTLTRDELGNQQDIAREKRADVRNKQNRADNMDDYITKQGIDFDFTIKRDKLQESAAKADAIMKHNWDLDKQDDVNSRFDRQQDRLENKDVFDQKMRLIANEVPAGIANKLANKMYNNEDLTPAEAQYVVMGARRSIKRSSGGGSGGGGLAGLTDKTKNQYVAARMKDNFVRIQNIDGTSSVVQMSNAPKDIMGNIVGLQGIASDGEKMRKISEEVDAMDSIRGKKPIASNPSEVLPVQLSLNAKWDGLIRNMVRQGDTESQIKNEIQDYLNKNKNVSEEEKEAINNSLINTGVLKKRGQFIPKTSRNPVGGIAPSKGTTVPKT